MRPDSDALPPGFRLDEYEIEKVLGRGGFAITYRAVGTSLGIPVAIKEYFPQSYAVRTARVTLRPSSEGTAELFYSARERFHREMQALARFRHPNIVRVSRVFQANDTYYAVLDFEQGLSLQDWLARLGRVPTQTELDRLLDPILSALAVIHANGMIHRDIAPDNIIVRNDGSPVLIDFGSAKDLQGSRHHATEAIVKHGFSPLEQYTGNATDQGPWTDIYALGATLFTTLTGSVPQIASERHAQDRVQPLSALLGRGYRPGFLHGIDWSLSLHHRGRPQDVAIWRQELFADAVVGHAHSQSPTSDQPVTRIETGPPVVASNVEIPQGPGPAPTIPPGAYTVHASAALDDAWREAPRQPLAVTSAQEPLGRQAPAGRTTRQPTEIRQATSTSNRFPLRAALAVGLSLLSILGGLGLALSPDFRYWVAGLLPAAQGCMVEPRLCDGVAAATPGAPGATQPLSVTAKPLAPAAPAPTIAIPRQEPTPAAGPTPGKPSQTSPPPAAPGAPPGDSLSSSAAAAAPLLAAVANLESCLQAAPCNERGCRRAFESVTDAGSRDGLADRIRTSFTVADQACRSQREDGALAELNACAIAEPCEFEALCISDFNAIIVGSPSPRASTIIATARRSAAAQCKR